MRFSVRTFFKKAKPSNEKGFTILELTFVILIFAIMASIVLFDFRDFGTKASLDNLTQDIALRVVQAQKAALSGLLNPNFFGTVAPTYGVYFESGTATDTGNHEFTYFTDIDAVGAAGYRLYNAPPGGCPATPTVGNECVSVTSITTGEYVSNICYLSASTGTVNCNTPGSAHITFTRPFPDATMKVCNTAGACPTSAADAQITYIEVTSGIDPTLKKTIVVTNLGEVRVYNGSACAASGGTSC
jgi:prepilin-type N-terminal cleavage/methylation domain-containing protein